MNTLKDYVNFKLTHADKVAEAEGYPLTMENCKKHKKMRDLKVYGNSVQDGTPTPETPIEIQSVGGLVTDETDINYGRYKIPVVVRGKNLATAYDVCKGLASYKATVLDGRECVSYHSNWAKWYTDYPFKENTQYIISFDVKSLSTGTNAVLGFNCILGFWYTDGTFGSANYNPPDAAYNIDTGIDVEWRRVVLTSRAGKTVKSIGVDGNHYVMKHHIDVNTFQLEEGAANTEYEPYIEPVTTNIYLDEPLRKLGDYADYIDFKENKVVRKNYKQVFNSSIPAGEAVAAWQREGHYCCICAPALKVAGIREVKAYSNRFKQGNWSWSGNSFPGNYFYQAHNDTNLHVIINKQYLDGITDESTPAEKIAAFKAFFDKYETYLIYPRKTPIEEPLNIDLPKLASNTTIIEVDTSLAPSNVYGKYIKR